MRVTVPYTGCLAAIVWPVEFKSAWELRRRRLALVHHRTMIAPAIIRPRAIDTNSGPTSRSRRSNFSMWGMLTAFLVAGVRILSHRQLPSMDGDDHTRLSFRCDVEGNRQARHESGIWADIPSKSVGQSR
jgi:hypothetical protein